MSDETWPDEEQRAARRAKLHETLDTFLDTFITDEKKGGFAKATDAHILDLDDIVREIIDLKFQRDEDGDQVVLPRYDNRRYGRMVFAYVPHGPKDRGDALQRARYQSELARAVSTLTGSASEAMRMLEIETSDRVADLERDVVIEKKIAEVRDLIAGDDFEAAEAIVVELTQGNVIAARQHKIPIKHPLIRDPKDPRIEMIRHELAMANASEGLKITMMINEVLDRFERAAPNDRSIEHAAHTVLSAGYTRFGRSTFSDQIARFNRIAEKNRAERKAAITPS